MRIINNLPAQVQGRNAGKNNIPVNRQQIVSKRISNSGNVQARQILRNAPSEHSLSNAMIIMQKARAIISQALNISSRLVNQAQVTFTSGNVNTNNISVEVSAMNNSFSEFSATISQPPIQNSALEKLAEGLENDIGTITQMTQNNTPASEFEPVIRQLNERNEVLDKIIEENRQKMINIANGYEAPRPDAARLRRSIANDSSRALAAQGNIFSENVSGLLG